MRFAENYFESRDGKGKKTAHKIEMRLWLVTLNQLTMTIFLKAFSLDSRKGNIGKNCISRSLRIELINRGGALGLCGCKMKSTQSVHSIHTLLKLIINPKHIFIISFSVMTKWAPAFYIFSLNFVSLIHKYFTNFRNFG